VSGEKRTDERILVNFPARWHGVSGGHDGRVEDLSVAGCFVNTKGAFDVGEIVVLMIKLPSGRCLPLRGKVVFAQQLTGFSLSFSILDERERDALAQLIAESG
jgi:hypothetical protein